MYNKNIFLLNVFVCLSFLLSGQEKKQRPNFIQILTDDQGWGDLASFGHDVIITPNIDQLAKEGLKFTNCYAAAAVCSPSRAAILTGRTPFRNGVYRWLPSRSNIYLPVEEKTLPQILKANGYQTGHFGKWHLSHYGEKRLKGDGTTPEKYTNFTFGGAEGEPSMEEYGYDYYFATGNVARPTHENPINFFLNGKAMGTMKGFSAQIVAEQAIRWIEEIRDNDVPFFLTIWFHEPHGPIESDPKFLKKYKSKYRQDPSMVQYLANVTQLDAAVGSIVNSLKKIGKYENTLIWYTSDNGPEGDGFGTFNKTDSPYKRSRNRGETGGLKGRKRWTHEGGVRVPGIISWPIGFKRNRIKPGNVSGIPIIGSDVFPTMLELANVSLPKDLSLDGVSLVPILEGKSFKRSKPLYWRNSDKVGLRIGKWKMIADGLLRSFELFNLEIDFRETTDLSDYEPVVFESMKKTLLNYDREVLLEGPNWYKNDKKYGGDKIPVISKK